jgi:hypothetical protein
LFLEVEFTVIFSTFELRHPERTDGLLDGPMIVTVLSGKANRNEESTSEEFGIALKRRWRGFR